MEINIEQYIDIFIEESREHLQIMNDVLLELEKDFSNLGYINEIFRVAHTIKGMAGTMGFHNVSNLTHEMENILESARNEKIELSENVIDILFECFDALETSIASIIENGKEDECENIALIDKLKTLLLTNSNNLDSFKKEDKNKPNVHIDEHVLAVMKKAKQKGFNAFSIEFLLSDFCILKSARAFIIFNTLEDIGEIVYSNPPVKNIEDEKFDRSFGIIVVTELQKSSVLEELNRISEVDSINIKSLVDENTNIDSLFSLNKMTTKSENKANKKVADKKATYSKNNKSSKTVRVDIERLDNLMNLVSELIIIKTRMDDVSESSRDQKMGETIEYLERITTSLHDAVMKVRMVPIESVFNRFPRLVRDLSKELNKDIELIMTGEETEVDRTVVDEIGDPLIHLLRNSIDHGIEIPADRVSIGKEKTGKVTLKAYPDGNNVIIEVEDDGRGLDHVLIKRKSIEKGLISEEKAELLTDEESVDLLFKAGFSTAETVSDISGRGVGLDVVRSKIESINGDIEVQSTINKGSRFIIRLPLTLAIIQALLINIKEEIYAIPLSSIIEIVRMPRSNISNIQNQDVVLYRDKTLPLLDLKNLMGLKSDKEDNGEIIVIIVNKGDKKAGLIVDNLIGQQEIVIKGLSKYLKEIKHFAGATILGNGNISLIIDVDSLI